MSQRTQSNNERIARQFGFAPLERGEQRLDVEGIILRTHRVDGCLSKVLLP